MSLSTRWHRLDAARWVHRLCVLEAVILGWLTAVTLVAGLLAGMPWLALVPAALTALAAWLAHAWGEERPWSWWALMTFGVLGAGWDLVRLLHSGPSVASLGHLLVDAAMLALLVHPASSARLERAPATGFRDPTRTPGGGERRAGRP